MRGMRQTGATTGKSVRQTGATTGKSVGHPGELCLFETWRPSPIPRRPRILITWMLLARKGYCTTHVNIAVTESLEIVIMHNLI